MVGDNSCENMPRASVVPPSLAAVTQVIQTGGGGWVRTLAVTPDNLSSVPGILMIEGGSQLQDVL